MAGSLSHDEIVPRKKLSDHVLERLVGRIREGALQPGDRLPSERELMVRYGVGRPAVREAMQALGNVGLIDIRHGERARVMSVSAATMMEQNDLTARSTAR